MDKNNFLWRYIDLAKLIDLLVTKTLFVPSASLFEDRREGLQHLPRMAGIDHFLRQFKAGYIGEKTENLSERDDSQEKLRQRLLVSCWNRSANESVALWKIYTSGYNGVCIRTDIDSLRNQLEPKFDRIFFDDVKYADIGKTQNPLDAFFRKSHEYSFEGEYRAVIELSDEAILKEVNAKPHFFMSNKKYGGLAISIEPTKLIKEIRVHYQAPGWLVDDVRKLIEAFGLQPGLVASSSLCDEI